MENNLRNIFLLLMNFVNNRISESGISTAVVEHHHHDQ
jgi:hypothetical protein